MQTVLIVIHLLVVLAMIAVVLLQKSEGGALGIGGGGSSFLSTRGTANVLTRTTAYLAGAFFLTSFVLSVLAGWGRQPQSIIGTQPIAPGAPVAPGPVQPGGSILDQLKQQAPQTPQAPQSK
jgi:preprotein translocase subunit SecG